MKYLIWYTNKPSRRQADLATMLIDAGHDVEFRKVNRQITGTIFDSITFDEIRDIDRERFNSLLSFDPKN